MPEHEIIKRLRVGEAPTAVELLATLDELAGSDSLAARFSDIVKGILDAWDNSLASIVVAFLCAGLQKHKGNEAAASQAAAGIKRCLHPTVNTGFVASLLEKHQAAAVSISAALSHPEHRPLHELVLLFGDAANTDIERQELVEANFFEAALQFANIAGPSGTKSLALCLANVLGNPSTRDVAHVLGVSKWAVQSLLRLEDAKDEQEVVLCVLIHSFSTSVLFCREAGKLRVFEAATSALVKNPGSQALVESVAKAACNVLNNGGGAKDAAAEVDFVRELISAGMAHVDTEEILCGVLTAVEACCGRSSRTADAVAECGGADFIGCALKTHEGSPTVQETAFWAASELIRSSRAGRRTMTAQCDLLNISIKSASLRPEHAGMQAAACSVLAELFQPPWGFQQPPGAQVLVGGYAMDTIAAHKHSAVVLKHAYALLAALASTSSVFLEEPEVRVPLAEGLTDAMEEFKDKPEIPAAVASVIGELAQSEKEELSGIVRFMAAEGGLVGRLADCATRFPRHPAVQAAVFMALDELIRVLQLDGVMQEAQAYDIENLTVKTVDTYGAERGARVSDNGIKHFARDGQQAYDRSSVLLAYLKFGHHPAPDAQAAEAAQRAARGSVSYQTPPAAPSARMSFFIPPNSNPNLQHSDRTTRDSNGGGSTGGGGSGGGVGEDGRARPRRSSVSLGQRVVSMGDIRVPDSAHGHGQHADDSSPFEHPRLARQSTYAQLYPEQAAGRGNNSGALDAPLMSPRTPGEAPQGRQSVHALPSARRAAHRSASAAVLPSIGPTAAHPVTGSVLRRSDWDSGSESGVAGTPTPVLQGSGERRPRGRVSVQWATELPVADVDGALAESSLPADSGGDEEEASPSPHASSSGRQSVPRRPFLSSSARHRVSQDGSTGASGGGDTDTEDSNLGSTGPSERDERPRSENGGDRTSPVTSAGPRKYGGWGSGQPGMGHPPARLSVAAVAPSPTDPNSLRRKSLASSSPTDDLGRARSRRASLESLQVPKAEYVPPPALVPRGSTAAASAAAEEAEAAVPSSRRERRSSLPLLLKGAHRLPDLLLDDPPSLAVGGGSGGGVDGGAPSPGSVMPFSRKSLPAYAFNEGSPLNSAKSLQPGAAVRAGTAGPVSAAEELRDLRASLSGKKKAGLQFTLGGKHGLGMRVLVGPEMQAVGAVGAGSSPTMAAAASKAANGGDGKARSSKVGTSALDRFLKG